MVMNDLPAFGYPRVGIVGWTGVNKAFDDNYSTYSTWSGYIYDVSNKAPYRCTWTDELR